MEIYMEAHRNLSLLHETLNRPHEAFNHFKAYIAVRDSIHNDENTKKSVQAEMLYQFERQQEQMRIEQAKRDAQIAEKVQRQRVLRNLLLVILLLAVALIGYVLASNRTKQRINARLELQQREILEKNEELLQQQEEILAQRDEIEKKNLVLERSRQIIVSKNERMVSSIEYAQTIQQAILPSEDVFKKSFKDYFIIYMPKDIVSGDFYWANKINHLLFAAVIDCTGHGVPGSFMSMIGNTLLNQIVNEWQTHDPALILEYLHQKVRQALKQDEKHSKSHASMDVAIMVIDTKKRRGVFAGASRPLYYIQGDKLTRIQGDPRSVGGFQRENKRYFTNHDIDLSKPTCIYLATDGYVDQPNPERRKFGTLPFTQLLTANHKKSMDVQRAILESEFQKHRHGEEQIDDVCILGLRV
jgi:serine phosphatase RsbU (regulator of sigma subunit)